MSPAPAPESQPELPPAACEPVGGPPQRVVLRVGETTTTASGMKVIFVGTSQDHHADGSFDVLAEFRLLRDNTVQTQFLSALAPTWPAAWMSMQDQCWRVVELNDEDALVEVSMPAESGESLSRCEADPSEGKADVPVFSTFFAAADEARFSATLRYDETSQQWSIAPPPTMLPHHATRIRWSNLATFAGDGFTRAQGSDVEIVFRFVSKEVTKIPDRRQWRSDHVAIVESACVR